MYLFHPGIDITEATIHQGFYWPGIRYAVCKEVINCDTCQRKKLSNKNNGKLPAKLSEERSCNKTCVDIIGPYTIQRNSKKENLQLKSAMVIDTVKVWFEKEQYEDKRVISIAKLVETTWMSRYPRPIEIAYDKAKEFIGNEFRKYLIEIEYGIASKPSTSGDPMYNAVLERVHQVLGNLVRTFNISTQTYVDKNDT